VRVEADPDAVRALVPAGASVEGEVREILARVRAEGDAAVLEHERRFGGGGSLRVGDAELARAVERLAPVGGLGHHLDVPLRLEDQAEPAADERLVVDDQDPDHDRRGVVGIRAWTA
jgi:hypothetical protein